MVNILVIEDNIYYSKNLINLISDINSKMRVYNISTDGKEAIDIIKMQKDNIDIILLDLKLPHYSGVEILDYIESNNIEKYKNSIIVISSEVDLMLQVRNSTYLYSFINKVSGLENIVTEINKLIEIKEKEKSSVEYKISNELKKLHYNFSYNGTKYLMEAILLLYDEDNFEDIKLEKEIYSKIARKYKKTINNIKTNIIHATDLMCYDCATHILNEYFGIYDNEKPTPKIVISTIINNLKYKI